MPWELGLADGYKTQANVAIFPSVKSHNDTKWTEQEYLGIMFSGGRAPEYIRYDPDLVRITNYFFATNKPVASVCHGVEIPARAGIVKGLRMATVPKCKFDLEVCGGIFVNAPVVIDRHMVSGRTFHDNGAFVGLAANF